MNISIIAAIAENGVIGSQGKLPWHLPADLEHFKKLTFGKPIIMGRKTYESLEKPLTNRRNIVLTKNKIYKCQNCEIFSSLPKALNALKNEKEIMILGGTEIFKEAFFIADKMYLTIVHHSFTGDTYFPAWDQNQWQEIEHKDFTADAENPYSYSFITLKRL